MSYDALGDMDYLPPKRTVFVQRLTLTCSHIKLWGPFRDADQDKMVGDHMRCDVCPTMKSQVTGAFGTTIKQLQLVVKAEIVDEKDCSPAWIQTGLL